MNYALILLAQAPAAASASGQAGPPPVLNILIVGGCLFAFFYVMAIRPQSLRQKEQAALVAALKTGDKVVTAAGIHGLISNVKETTVILKVADNVKIEVDKTSITTIAKRSDSETSAS